MEIRDYLYQNFNRFDDRQELFNSCSKSLDVSRRAIQKVYKEEFKPTQNQADASIIEYNSELMESRYQASKLAKEKQRLQDTNRMERKNWRSNARTETVLEDFYARFEELLNDWGLPSFKDTVTIEEDRRIGIIHLTDVHFNDVGCDDAVDGFFETAAFLKLYADEVKRLFKAYDITNVLIAMTGDLLNSDSRLDQLLTNSQVRAEACFIGSHILAQFINDINEDFGVTVAYVVGNESRIDKDIAWRNKAAKNNFDYIIHQNLKLIFQNSDIRFIDGDPIEALVEVGNKNILLLHGNAKCLNHNDLRGSVQSIIGRYAMKGIILDYVLCGHTHNTQIGDNYSRGGSLSYTADYAESNLNKYATPSQNAIIISEKNRINAMRIGLENCDLEEGYEIPDINIDKDNIVTF